jgi:hypothetical protein
MLQHAWDMGVPMQWVTGDSVYGCSQELLSPQEQTGGRTLRKLRLAAGEASSQTVAEVIAGLPKSRWRRLGMGGGTKGPRLYDWIRLRVIESYDDATSTRGLEAFPPLGEQTRRDGLLVFLSLLARFPCKRCYGSPEPATALSSALEKPRARSVSKSHEVRHFHSWHRHITLALMAHTRARSRASGSPISASQVAQICWSLPIGFFLTTVVVLKCV